MTAVEILEKAKKLIEKGWTQGTYAKTEAGDRVPSHYYHAALFCMDGAVRRICGDRDGHDVDPHTEQAFNMLSAVTTGDNCRHVWNDAPGRTQAEVVAAFTKAIELAKAQP